ncbi:DUF418 domain-containing protein [Nonomuraea jiangxiensis]|uniref:Uncharacterized membrane protein YeiB n=1 Tax=Nonomuraea jiangxiensis TaxID=633440 RepID=A0A1G9A887_9ACTN|nr:DUF418 domain-containing protein [Nonomuraea jiangxiensis]SDK23034.1 Uncharacterized membrane protein YeiB [Nonomuraea jiangxiensis]
MDTTIQAATSSSSPPGAPARALAPDLARGFMLLAIAFAHAPLFVVDIDRGPAVANDITTFFHTLFVGNHARPMFAFLFGYSLVQLLHRQTQRGSDWPGTRKLLRRRGWWLVAIGFVHMALLVPIDILAVYGLAAVLLVGMLRCKDSTLLWTAGLTMVPATAVIGFAMAYPMAQGISTFTAGSVAAGTRGLWELFIERLVSWPFGMIAMIAVFPGMLFGMWAARRCVLDEPARHRGFLLRVAVITTVLSLFGSIPAALILTGAWAEPSGVALWTAAIAQPLTGYLGGIGMAAIVGLFALTTARRRNSVTTAVQALGQRSMSLYIFQSIVFVAVFYPYGLGLQDELGLAGATGVAAATWVLSILIADVMRRMGHRGPAEILLRRLAYRRPRPPQNLAA